MKVFKKILSAVFIILLCVILVLCNVSLLSIEPSIDYRIDEVRSAWSRDNGPEVEGHDIDYSYYSPVEHGASKDKKYPLVVIMAGALEGLQQGFELIANALAVWSTEDNQKQFKEGNAFLLIARAPEEDWLYWDCDDLTPALKGAIDSFCGKNPAVNTDEIHIIGWCLGGNGAINLSTSYPNDFASATIMCPSRAISKKEAQALKNMPVWFVGSKKDTYSNYKLTIQKSYDRLCQVSNRPEDVRLTSYDTAPDVYLLERIPFIFNHDLWTMLASDYKSDNAEYSNMKTVDGKGNEVSEASAFSWLNSQSLSDSRADVSEQEIEEKNNEKLIFADLKVYFKSRLMKLMLNCFTLFGWI